MRNIDTIGGIDVGGRSPYDAPDPADYEADCPECGAPLDINFIQTDRWSVCADVECPSCDFTAPELTLRCWV